MTGKSISRIRKTDIVRAAVQVEDWKRALRIAKDFKLGISKEQQKMMSRAYECMVHPDFYEAIGVDLAQAVQAGVTVLNSLYR